MSDPNRIPLNNANAKAELAAGRAEAHALWFLLGQPMERYGFALQPEVWEGPGEYQHITHQDGRSVLVYVPFGEAFKTRRLIEEDEHRKAERARIRRAAPDASFLVFDGCGINGPDQYRSRLATFHGDAGAKYGTLFAAAPELRAALINCRNVLSLALPMFRTESGDEHDSRDEVLSAIALADAAIAKVGGAS